MYNVHFNNNLVRLVSLAKPAHQFTKFSVHILKDTNKKNNVFKQTHSRGCIAIKNSYVNNNNNNNNNNNK